jgi:hypothetical protein
LDDFSGALGRKRDSSGGLSAFTKRERQPSRKRIAGAIGVTGHDGRHGRIPLGGTACNGKRAATTTIGAHDEVRTQLEIAVAINLGRIVIATDERVELDAGVAK